MRVSSRSQWASNPFSIHSVTLISCHIRPCTSIYEQRPAGFPLLREIRVSHDLRFKASVAVRKIRRSLQFYLSVVNKIVLRTKARVAISSESKYGVVDFFFLPTAPAQRWPRIAY